MDSGHSIKYLFTGVFLISSKIGSYCTYKSFLDIVRNKGIAGIICDMIKRNESDVRDVVFEILAKTVFKFLCFILFLALSNPS